MGSSNTFRLSTIGRNDLPGKIDFDFTPALPSAVHCQIPFRWKKFMLLQLLSFPCSLPFFLCLSQKQALLSSTCCLPHRQACVII